MIDYKTFITIEPGKRSEELLETMFQESRRIYGKVKNLSFKSLQTAFAQMPDVKVALLFIQLPQVVKNK
jgi:hypothetical protein